MSRPISRICVVRYGGMGDILLATPAVRALSRHFDTNEIDFIVGRGMKAALEGIPYLRHIIEFDKDGPDAQLRNFLPFLRDLRSRRYDLFVNFHPNAKSILMALVSGAPRIITFRKDRRKQADTGRVRHAIDDFTKELMPLGIPVVTDRRMDFVVPEIAHEKVRALLAAEGIGLDDTLLVVNPAGTRDINRWPAPRFAEFLSRMAREMPRVRLVLCGGPGDVDLANGILAATDAAVVNTAGRLRIKELGALLARASVVLTGDTGPLHIAAALGTPLVCLSGAADPDRTGPSNNPRDLVVIHRDLPCVPCQGRSCARGDIACMTQMPVDWVFEAVRRRLSSPSSLPPVLAGRVERNRP